MKFRALGSRITWLVLAGALAPALAHAQNPPGIGPLDHYKAYRIQTPLTTVPVIVRDQFGLYQAPAIGPFYLSPPASKNGEGIHDPVIHYTWYDFISADPPRSVIVTNQFGEYPLTAYDGRFLLVPALKNQPPIPGPLPPLPQNHFRCYAAQGASIDKTVMLETQFGIEQVVVTVPELLCNPAEKVHDGVIYPILDPTTHLVCYRILPPHSVGVGVYLQDQFGQRDAFVLDSQWLCVPSLKDVVTGTVPSTWSRVRAMYR